MSFSKKQEQLIKALYTRHGRKKHGLCICEGVRCCTELFAERPDLVEFIVCSESFDYSMEAPCEALWVSDTIFSRLSKTVNSQGILAVARKPDLNVNYQPTDDFICALDRVGDPGNFGTILRTAKAAGLKELWYTAGSVDPYSDKAIRSAMAAQFSMNLRCFTDLRDLSAVAYKFGYDSFYLTDPHEGNSCFTEEKLFDRSVVIIGSEAHGVGELTGAERVTIPMPGNFESLNAAQAATIFLFEYVRRLTS
jgi:TrmH family RNA methyltransferase